jgi:hypothetical protein
MRVFFLGCLPLLNWSRISKGDIIKREELVRQFGTILILLSVTLGLAVQSESQKALGGADCGSVSYEGKRPWLLESEMKGFVLGTLYFVLCSLDKKPALGQRG